MYGMERFAAAHACEDGVRAVVSGGVPALFDSGRCGKDGVVTFIIKGDCFEAILSLFDIGAGSYFIILEEYRASRFSLGVCVKL